MNFITKKTILSLVIFASLFMSSGVADAGEPYTPLVSCGLTSQSADRCTLCHLLIGIRDIINWGRSILVVAAIVAIVAGGIMYIVSAGDSKMMESAKGIIKQALWGALIVLCAWVIINTILFFITSKLYDTTGAPGSEIFMGIANWSTFNCDTTRLDPGRLELLPGTGPVGTGTAVVGAFDPRCAAYEADFVAASGGNNNVKCLLRSVAMGESNCNPNANNGTAYGIMQMKPSTAGMTPQQLLTSPQASIQRAAAVLQDYSTRIAAYRTTHGYDIGMDDTIAAYNGGYGDRTVGTTKQPFALSTDCTSTPTPAWQCPINPDDYANTQAYVSRVLGYFNRCVAE